MTYEIKFYFSPIYHIGHAVSGICVFVLKLQNAMCGNAGYIGNNVGYFMQTSSNENALRYFLLIFHAAAPFVAKLHN